jgi:hypothetical protein
LKHIGLDNNFPNRTPIAQQIRERVDKWNRIKLKSCTQQRKHLLEKRHRLQNGRKFCCLHSEQRLITRIHRELNKLNSQSINNPMSKFINELNIWLSKGVQIANKYMKKCSASLTIKEMQIKSKWHWDFTLL